MKIILHKRKLIRLLQGEKDLGFVPTMGAIHRGHLSLIKKSNNLCNRTIVTIFVNRGQFNRKSDYLSYPRILKKDIKILKRLKIDYLYLPTNKQIYPKGQNKKIQISSFSRKLCGKNRPGHFKSVVDVVDRFIKIIKPQKIFLGKKDMQQLKIIEHFIKNNKIKTKVIGCKTIREKNGVALSSRNFLLNKNEKAIASKVYYFIRKNKNRILKNKLEIKKIKKKIYDFGVNKIDYIKVFDINKINKPYIKSKYYKIFIAYYLRSTRLIDNI